MKSTSGVCVVLLLAHTVTSALSSPILNPFQLFGELFRNMMHPPYGSLVSSMGYTHVYNNNNNAAGAPPHHAPPSISSSITTSVQLTQSLGGDQTGGSHVYSQQSRPYLDWGKHVLGQGGGRPETVPTTTESSMVTTELSFPDYIRRATYDWMKKYKLAYFAKYYLTPAPGPSTSPTTRDAPLTTPKTTLTTSTTAPTTSPVNTTTTLNTTEYTENTTTAASPSTASEPLSTTAIPTTESSTHSSSTTAPPTTTSVPTTTAMTTSATTTSTTTTRPTIRSTTPTTTALRPITVIDQAVDDMTGGFLPDQPNLGTRWGHHHIEHTVDNLV